jgi:hypothetical protein
MKESYDFLACVFNGHTSEVNVILLRSEGVGGEGKLFLGNFCQVLVISILLLLE